MSQAVQKERSSGMTESEDDLVQKLEEGRSEARVKNAIDELLEPERDGVEKELLMFTEEGRSLDVDQHSKVMEEAAKIVSDRTGVPVDEFVERDMVGNIKTLRHPGMDDNGDYQPKIEVEAGTGEIEIVSAPHNSVSDSANQISDLENVLVESFSNQEEDMYLAAAGHLPSMMDPQHGEEVGDPYVLSNFKPESEFESEDHRALDLKALRTWMTQKPRYWQHTAAHRNENSGIGFGQVISTASTQETVEGPLWEYVEKHDLDREDLERLQERIEDGGEIPEDHEFRDAMDEYVRDMSGGGDVVGLPVLSDLLVPFTASSPVMDDDESWESYRPIHWTQGFMDSLGVGKGGNKVLDNSRLREVESNHDLTKFRSTMLQEFGPSLEAGEIEIDGKKLHEYEEFDGDSETEVPTAIRPESGRSLRESLENGEMELFVMYGTEEDVKGQGELTKDISDVMDRSFKYSFNPKGLSEEEVQSLYELNETGTWFNAEMPTSLGYKFEMRPPGSTPDTEWNAKLIKGFSRAITDIQQHFAEDYGVENVSLEEGSGFRTRMAKYGEDARVTFEIEDIESEVTWKDMMFGAEYDEGTVDPVLPYIVDGIRESEGEQEAREWVSKVADPDQVEAYMEGREDVIEPDYGERLNLSREIAHHYSENGGNIVEAMVEAGAVLNQGEEDEYA